MSRSIAISELKRQKAARESEITRIDDAIALLEGGIHHRKRRANPNGANPMAAAHAALAEKRAKAKVGRKPKAAPLAEVAEA